MGIDIPPAPKNILLENLEWAIERLAREQGIVLDTLQLHALGSRSKGNTELKVLQNAARHLSLVTPASLASPDQVKLPFLTCSSLTGWAVVVGREPNGTWLVVGPEGESHRPTAELVSRCFELQTFKAVKTSSTVANERGFRTILSSSWRPYRGSLIEASVATVFIGALALVTSLFSMQVYDRVIPTHGSSTLVVLSIGVLLAILFELLTKLARSSIMDHVTVGLDSKLSREIFQRLLQLRVDQMPASVGSLAGQLRGYEQVRSFYTASTLFTLVDVPLAIMFAFVISMIATPTIALVPIAAGLVAFCLGVLFRRRIKALTKESAKFSNLKTGLLVEAVEGVETIKSGSGGWKMLRRWIDINAITIKGDLKLKNASENMGYIAATLQQMSYAGVVIVGALAAIAGDITMGGLIACSILSGRILTPIMALPGLMVQHSHAQAAIEGLDQIYKLKTDNCEIERPLIPAKLYGNFSMKKVGFSYEKDVAGLNIANLSIRAGERVGIIGPIGSGKSTLLRLLSGIYVPTEGRVELDGFDLNHISREVINRNFRCLQQEHRLFQGTLRENLLIGMPDPGDDALMRAMHRSGMERFVKQHPKGLDRSITEGGKGLSGGQRQLLAFTRLLLSEGSVLLLDEPTANMDIDQKARCMGLLKEVSSAPGTTLLISTHDPSFLPLVDRIIVVSNNRVTLDGPKDVVLAKLAAASNAPAQARKLAAAEIQKGVEAS